jgi:RNA polymerase sigma-70 factor (ECF subfamily)
MQPGHERELVERCRSGDEQAFQQLVERHKDLVFALITRTIADRSRAEDLAQEVFLRVYRGLPYFRGEAKLSTWIYRIVTNVVAQDRQGTPAPVSLDDDRAIRRPPAGATVESGYAELERRDQLEKAIAKLPANQRLLIAAHYLEGLRYEDLAESMQLPLGTVKTLLHRAKRQLRVWLEGELK